MSEGFFSFTFPYRKYCQYHPLYRVKVSGGPCTIPPDEVLPQVAVKVPVCMLFYCPMHSGYCAQLPGTSVKTGDIEPPLGRFLTIRFSLRCSPYFDNRQISIPLFPVRNQVISTKDTAYSGLYSAMFKKGPSEYTSTGSASSTLSSTPYRRVLWFAFSSIRKSPPFSRILSMMAFWKDMASAVTMHPDTSTLSNSLGTEVISLLFLRTCPWQRGETSFKGIGGYDVGVASVFKVPSLSLPCRQYRGCPGTTDKLIMEGGGKFRHPLRHGFIINMFEYTAERRFRRHAVQQNS